MVCLKYLTNDFSKAVRFQLNVLSFNNKMKTILLFFLFEYLAFQQLSPVSNVLVSLPISFTSKIGNRIEYNAKFNVNCISDARLSISPSNTFQVSLNGVNQTQVRQSQSSDFTLSSLKCGQNSLVISVGNNNNLKIAPNQVFSVTQDQSSCYTCQSSQASYNKSTCQCQCKFNKTYTCQLAPLYLNIKVLDCKCICPPRKCNVGFSQNSNTCQCVKKSLQEN